MISFKRRGLALLGTLAIVVTACGGTTATPSAAPASPPASGAAPTTAASPSAPAAEVGDFKFVVDSEPTTLATEPDDLPTSWITGELYSTLYQPDYKLNYVPLLASAAPETSADGLTWTIKLRDGVLFHDGSTMTSADVKFTYDLHLSKNCRGNPDACSSISDNVASVDAPDPSTVVFHLKQKYAPFLSVGLGATLIVPKKAIEDSFARFQTAADAVTADEVSALVKKVADGRRPKMPPARRRPARTPRRRLPPASSRPTRPSSRRSSARPASRPSTRPSSTPLATAARTSTPRRMPRA